MARIQTPINGISTTSAYQEGDCYSLVNLRPKNGSLRPVAPRKELLDLSQKYDIVFVHHVSGTDENWIGVVNFDVNGDNRFSVYRETRDGQPENIISAKGKVKGVQQIGNTLSFITANGIEYALFNNNAYKFLGKLPELQVLKNYIYVSAASISLSEYGAAITEENFDECIRGIFGKLTKTVSDNNGLCDNCLMVYAFRLYDNSIIRQSSPVLINKAGVRFNRATHNGNFDVQNSYVSANNMHCYFDVDLSYLNDWKDIITSVDIFITPGLGYVSASNLPDKFQIDDYANESKPMLKGYGNMIENIKKTGTFYLIKQIPAGTVSRMDPIRLEYVSLDGDNEIGGEELNEIQNYQVSKIHIPDESVFTGTENIIYQERLPVDSYSHGEMSADVFFCYNERLHLAKIKNSLFRGYDIDFFALMYSVHEKFSSYGYDYYLGGDMYRKKDAMRLVNGLIIEIEVEISGKTCKLYTEKRAELYFWFDAYFSYPDSRARKARFYEILPGGKYRIILEIDLEPNPALNNAFYLSIDEEKKQPCPPVPDPQDQDIELQIDTDNCIIEANKMKVSETGNPFYFPNKNTYTVGNGEILALATVGIRIPEGSFGQYPLYVFTTNGIYALSVGTGDVLYSSQATPTSYEIPITGIVCPTPFGVAFISPRGICIIGGQQVDLLTPQLQQPPQNLHIQTNEILDGVVLNLTASFTDFLKVIEYILYNPAENELIIHDKDAGFNYVYCFDSRQFYQSTEKFDNAVQNTFPDLLVIEDKKIKDYSQSQSPNAHVSLITRPLLFGTPDLKRLERMIVRTNLFDIQNPAAGKQSVLLNYYSIDEVNFRILRGIGLNPGSRKDIDMGMFARSKFRQFMLAFAGVVDEKSEIKFIETEIEKEYQNTKMR
jgi:hypothetical protein